jgi:hypothetical protein
LEELDLKVKMNMMSLDWEVVLFVELHSEKTVE